MKLAKIATVTFTLTLSSVAYAQAQTAEESGTPNLVNRDCVGLANAVGDAPLQGFERLSENAQSELRTNRVSNCRIVAQAILADEDFESIAGLNDAAGISVGNPAINDQTETDLLVQLAIRFSARSQPLAVVEITEQEGERKDCQSLANAVRSGPLDGESIDLPIAVQNQIRQTRIGTCLIVAQALLKPADFLEIPGLDSAADIKIGNLAITTDTDRVLAQAIERRLTEYRSDRLNSKSKRFVRGCFNSEGESGIGALFSDLFHSCSLRRSNTPNTKAASQPALISFTRDLDAEDGDQRDVFEVAAGFRATGGINGGDTAYSFATEFQRNTKEGSQQANFNLALGIVHDIYDAADLLDEAIIAAGRDDANAFRLSDGYWSIRLSGELQFNTKGIFGDPDSEPCMMTPDAAFCGRQDMESIRLVGNISPYFDALNGVDYSSKGDPTLAWAVSPVFGLFYDEALNDDVVLASGETADGSVLGFSAGVSASVSPGIFKNRWQLSGSAKIIETLDRSTGRVEDFDQSSTELIASLSYAFRDGSYVGQSTTNNLVPAISVTYANGSDPLRGRDDRETLTIAFSVLY